MKAGQMNFADSVSSRREALLKGGGGFGGLVLSAMLRDTPLLAATPSIDPKSLHSVPSFHGHFPALAKRVIFLFMEGGPSQMDSFDPKPKLNELAGQQLPPGYKRVITAMG